MNCEEVRNLITLYVDGELDPSECREMVEHIASCESCYFAVRSERFIKKFIKNSLVLKEPPLSLISRINSLYSEKRYISPAVLRWAPAFILLLLIALLFYYKISGQRFDERIFENLSNPPLTASISDINKALSIFKNPATKIPIDSKGSPKIRFVGLRYNKLDDRDAAHILYNHKGRNISVFAISGSIYDKIYPIPLRPFKGNSFIVKRGDQNLILESNNNVTFAVAGDADEEELYEILSSIR